MSDRLWPHPPDVSTDIADIAPVRRLIHAARIGHFPSSRIRPQRDRRLPEGRLNEAVRTADATRTARRGTRFDPVAFTTHKE